MNYANLFNAKALSLSLLQCEGPWSYNDDDPTTAEVVLVVHLAFKQ